MSNYSIIVFHNHGQSNIMHTHVSDVTTPCGVGICCASLNTMMYYRGEN